jgi:hypothetical protein
MMLLKLSALSSVFSVPALLGMATRSKRVTLRPLNAPIVLPAAQMLRLIRRECARIDRNGLSCALGVFQVPDGGPVPAMAQTVVTALRERARLTDVVGWLDERTLCAFLTDSTLDGATAFAKSVQSGIADEIPALRASVHTYDGKWAVIGGDEGVPAEPVPALAMSA